MEASEENTPLKPSPSLSAYPPALAPVTQQQYVYPIPPAYANIQETYQLAPRVPPQYPQYGIGPSGGYVMIPPVPQATSYINLSNNKHVSSKGSLILGALLGIFCPILSLLLFCHTKTLHLKRGVCIGHLINCLLVAVTLAILSFVWITNPPTVPCDIAHCLTDVMQGHHPSYWAISIPQCEAYNICPMVFDFNNPGPQSYLCAECVCQLPTVKSACENENTSIVTPVCLLFGSLLAFVGALVALRGSSYYRFLIQLEVVKSTEQM